MADWKKVESTPADVQTTETDAIKEVKKDKKQAKAEKAALKKEKATAKAEEKRQALVEYAKKMQEKQAEKAARFDKGGRRRGRFSWAAPLGLIMSLLAVIGAIALIIGAVQVFDYITDDTALRDEAYYFLQPLMAYNPVPDFDDINEEDIDQLLQAAVWRITDAERIRMLREKDDNTVYELDSNGRLIVPVAQIEESYTYLFGKDAKLNHRSLKDEDLEYSEANACYYVPFNFINSLHQPILDSISRRGGTYYVRVAYVSINDLQVDEHGNTITPTADMASFEQMYVLKRHDGHFIVTAVGEEG